MFKVNFLIPYVVNILNSRWIFTFYLLDFYKSDYRNETKLIIENCLQGNTGIFNIVALIYQNTKRIQKLKL